MAHHQDRFDLARSIWNRLGAPDQLPPFVNVLAASTAIAVRDLADADVRLRQVFADQPTHIAANIVAADLDFASEDTVAELDHLDVAYSQDPVGRKVGLRFVRRLIHADRLDRADEVIDVLSDQDFDEASLENLEYQQRRSSARRAYLRERESARQARIREREI